MSFELDPIFHTESMAKILQSQGHIQLAQKVCLSILKKDPANARVRDLSERLKNPQVRVQAQEEGLEKSEDEDTEPGVPVEELQVCDAASAAVPSVTPEEAVRGQKLEKLKALLGKILERSS